MTKPFETFAPKYYELGYSIIPLKPKTKQPFMDNWSSYCESLVDEDTFEEWCEKYGKCNLGICCGVASGIIAIDIDIRSERNKWIISPVAKVGNSERITYFFRYNGESSQNFRYDGKTEVELLSNGRQTVLPPSIHPELKREFFWDTYDTLYDVSPKDLPYFDIEKLKKSYHVSTKKTSNSHCSLVSINELKSALESISSEDYAMWIEVGMAIHSEKPDSEGFQLWDNWSRTSAKYKEGETERKWKSFDARSKANPIKIDSVFFYARKAGWLGYFEESTDQMKSNILTVLGPVAQKEEPVKNETETNDASSEIAINKNLDFILPEIPSYSLVKEVADWLLSTARRQQPVLATSAALTLVSCLKAPTFQTTTGLRPCFYAVGIAPSGGGKNWPLEGSRKLLKCLDLSKYELGEPHSESAIINALKLESNRILLWDEFGLAFPKYANATSSTHEKAVIKCIMSLFSNSTIRSQQYADNEKNPETLIENCALSFLGMTTPEPFFKSLKSAHILDGLLARILIFPALFDQIPPQNKNKVQDAIPPLALTTRMEDLYRMSIERARYNPVRPGDGRVSVPFSPEAQGIIAELNDKYDKKVNDCLRGNEEYERHAIYCRTVEHISKVALTVCDERGEEITVDDLLFAISLVESSQKIVVERVIGEIRRRSAEFQSSVDTQDAIVNALKGLTKPVNRGYLLQKTCVKRDQLDSELRHLVQLKKIKAIRQPNGDFWFSKI